MLTVEHIAPRNPSVELDTEWDKAIYEAPDTINTLGNLILLPRSANASISNRSWRAKRLLYQAYSSSTLDEADTLIEAARSGGLEIGDNSQAIVQNSRYLPLVKALAAREGAWDAAFITSRSERIASLAYDRFISWLAPM